MIPQFIAAAEGPVGISLAWSIPFIVLLLSIALMPLTKPHWWEKHYPKVAIGLALIPLIYYLAIARAPGPWLSAMEEYFSFIVLLSSLFVISGGIAIRVNRQATPAANTTILLIGSIIANLFGTTGASMLLIRPYLRMNRGHIKPFHIVFFIFTVANCGGLLTPIGDPPLFLGYLNGVPFEWTVQHLWPIWMLSNGVLLLVFFLIDSYDHRKMPRPHQSDPGPQVHILGIHNFIFISAVAFAVFRPGVFEVGHDISTQGLTLGGAGNFLFSRELIMIAAMVLSRLTASTEVYSANKFSYAPIREVAILFIGIFSTMAPALGWLGQNADKMGIKTPGQFYYISGSLSSILDNAPTYLTFLEIRLAEIDDTDIAQVKTAVEEMRQADHVEVPASLSKGDVHDALHELVADHPDRIRDGTLTENQKRVAFLTGVPRLNAFLIAISAGAVLFGACTYIGNGPNFMIKSIADNAGVKTPGFLRYILVYSLPILMPLYALIWFIFLR